MGVFVDCVDPLKERQTEIDGAVEEAGNIDATMTDQDTVLCNLEDRMAALQQALGIQSTETASAEPVETKASDSIKEINELVDDKFNIRLKSEEDKKYDLQWHDYFVATIAGGLGVVIDFLIVKTPLDIKMGDDTIKGSPLTGYLRSLGKSADDKTWGWIKWLEDKCKVPYDKSIDSLIKGLCPKTHRLHSLAHDPSLAGLIWAIKDMMSGTFTSIDKNGILKVEKIGEGLGFVGLLVAPVVWLGHIISDVFTKAGIPIPGWTYLQMLQVGSFGDKKRTISDLSRYMYLSGYDLRHLASMSTVPAVINVVVRIYHFLVNERPEKMGEKLLLCEKEYGQIRNNIKLHRMLMISDSIAATGNVAKVAAYQGNPLAINTAIWFDFLQEAIVQVQIYNRPTSDYEKSIESRHRIEDNFARLWNS